MHTSEKPQWRFYAAWIALQTLCVPVAFAISVVLMRIITALIGDYIYVDGVPHITEDFLLSYVFIPLIGLLMGLVQFGLLQRYLAFPGRWVPVTSACWLVGLLMILALREAVFFFSTPEAYYESSFLNLNLILLGLSIGIGQWLLLRNQVPQSGWWVVGNSTGWMLVALLSGDALSQFGLIGVGMLPACATAVVLALLFDRTPPFSPNSGETRLA